MPGENSLTVYFSCFYESSFSPCPHLKCIYYQIKLSTVLLPGADSNGAGVITPKERHFNFLSAFFLEELGKNFLSPPYPFWGGSFHLLLSHPTGDGPSLSMQTPSCSPHPRISHQLAIRALFAVPY